MKMLAVVLLLAAGLFTLLANSAGAVPAARVPSAPGLDGDILHRTGYSTGRCCARRLVRVHRRHVQVYRRSWVVEPRACAAVRFPRSPLCASVPVVFSPFVDDFPWVSY